MGPGVPCESRSTELALGAGGVVDAVKAVAGVGVTKLGGALRVCVPAAVTWNTGPGGFVEAGAAPVALGAAVLGKALVTHWEATRICTGTDRDTDIVQDTCVSLVLYCCIIMGQRNISETATTLGGSQSQSIDLREVSSYAGNFEAITHQNTQCI